MLWKTISTAIKDHIKDTYKMMLKLVPPGCHHHNVVEVAVELIEHGQVGVGICVGWHSGNAVDGSGCGGAAERIAAMARSTLLTFDCLLRLAGPGFPCWPRLCSGGEDAPVEAELGEAAG